MKIFSVLFAFSFSVYISKAQPDYHFTKSISIQKQEQWFGGAVNKGSVMPFENNFSLNLYGNNEGNQAAPLLLSTNGRYIWSEKPFEFSIKADTLHIKSLEEIKIKKAGNTLREAFRAVSKESFPASGQMPDSMLFTSPQYNTWIELLYNQNQEDILKYAHSIINNGFPPGVLMIDDNWAPYYGKFKFRKDRFSDPKKMISELHQLGFKVMVWVCPFISPDTEVFRLLLKEKKLLLSKGKNRATTWKDATAPEIINWWNGYSAEVDFTNPDAIKWYQGQLAYMQSEYGVDGFKLDAGDIEYYPSDAVSYTKATPNEQSEAWGAIGLKFPLNEYRAMWKRGGQPLAERLRDKAHSWSDLQTLIPNLTAAGLLGYQFTCPDMIGGGEFTSFIDNAKLDQDLYVRSAQIHALMPMMQFSASPWRVLDDVHFAAVKKAVALRLKFTPYILQLAKQSAQTGEPIARHMEYEFPNQGFAKCRDQFMLGDKIMVAPVVDKPFTRKVIFPKGEWKDEKGKIFKGPAVKTFDVAIDRLLWYERVNK
jgi:alpha-glucosidase